MESCARRKSASEVEQAAIPTLLRKDRVPLQRAICLAVAFAVYALKIPFCIPPLEFDVAAVSDAAKAALPALDRAAIVVSGLMIALCSAAVREALREPKLAAHATGRELLRTLLQLSGDILLIPFYACFAKERPLLGYQSTPQNLDILARCPSLTTFSQTPWLQNSLWAFAALMVADNVGNTEAGKTVRREHVKTPDGGVIALDWLEEPSAKVSSAGAAKPRGVLFVSSTFTGDATPYCVRAPCKHFSSRGWRCVVFVKRGCGLTMPNTQPVDDKSPKPAPWCLSGFADQKLAIDLVASRYPDVPICGLGLSTGGGQLRNYVNKVGKESKLSAAVVLDAAPEWLSAIESCDKRVPLLSQVLNTGVSMTMKACGHEACGHEVKPSAPAGGSDEEVLRGGMMEFMRDVMGPAHGYEPSLAGVNEYLRACQPAHASNCAIPLLELCTTNDTLQTAEMAQRVQSTYKASPYVVTAMTRQGTHMIRWEGWWPRCWVTRVAGEFFESSLQQAAAPAVSAATKVAKAAPATSASSLCGQDTESPSDFAGSQTQSNTCSGKALAMGA